MVRPEDALKGYTHGIPLDPQNLPDLPLIAHEVDQEFPDEQRYSVQFNAADLIELTRTPNYHTWQGERWLFCCNRPSVFLGCVDPDQLTEIAAAGKASREATIANLLSASIDVAPRLLKSMVDDTGSLYLFRCQSCSRLRAHVDMD